MPLLIKTNFKPWLITGGILIGILLSMLITFIAVFQLYHDDWHTVQAEVVATEVVRSREGTPTWSLKADIFYELEGKRYEEFDFKILHEDLREDTVAQQAEWPPGKPFTLYVHSNDPHSISLVPDGGRETLAAMLALLTPAALAAVIFPSLLIAQRSQRRKNAISKN